jgi:hypothetical protein
MKAITLIQPWASLILAQHKRIETRSWPSNYRGPLAIHAGVKIDREACAEFGYDYRKLPTGVVIAIAEMYDCVQFPHVLAPPDEFGDFAAGRYGFLLRDIRKIRPVVARGKLGLWEWARG